MVTKPTSFTADMSDGKKERTETEELIYSINLFISTQTGQLNRLENICEKIKPENEESGLIFGEIIEEVGLIGKMREIQHKLMNQITRFDRHLYKLEGLI